MLTWTMEILVCFTKRFAFVGIEKMTDSGMSIQRSCRLTTVFRGVARVNRKWLVAINRNSHRWEASYRIRWIQQRSVLVYCFFNGKHCVSESWFLTMGISIWVSRWLSMSAYNSSESGGGSGNLNLYAPKSLHFVKEIPYRNSGFGASFDLKKISKKL